MDKAPVEKKKRKSGYFSRAKGLRGERELVVWLRTNGYDAKRVPLSGAMVGYKHDIVVTHIKSGEAFTIETKFYQPKIFQWLYDFYAGEYKDDHGTTRSALYSGGPLFAIGLDPILVSQTGAEHVFHNRVSEQESVQKVLIKVMKLDKIRDGADILAIKTNRRKRLFLKFWGV